MGTNAITLSAQGTWRWQIVGEWALAAVLVVVLYLGGFLRGWLALNTDFPNDYLVASLYRHHIPLDRVYEWDWLQRQNDRLGISQRVAGFAPHPPADALPLLPFAMMPALQAKRVWLILNAGFLVLSIYSLKRVTSLGWRRSGVITLLCLFPLQVNFWLGQFYILLLLLICAAYYASQRGHQLASGLILSIAGSLKLFPLLFVLFFVRRRAWQAVLGLIAGTAVISALSVALFGVEAHRVYLLTVLPRALLGDLLSPYSMQWNSFAALWHRLFLFEPELNPVPVLNSTTLYVLAQVVTLTGLTFAFFCLSSSEADRQSNTLQKLEWAAFVSLLLLLSPVPAPYQYCLLALSAALGVDTFLAQGQRSRAVVCLLLAVLACAHFSPKIERVLPFRLAANMVLYLFLLYCIHFREGQRLRIGWRWVAFSAVDAASLAAFCVWTVQGRAEDLPRHIPNLSAAYRSSSPLKIAGGIAWIQSDGLDGYHIAVQLLDGPTREITPPGDALALAATPAGASMFSEMVGQTSVIARLFPFEPQRSPELFTVGQRPAVSSQGRWFAILRDAGGRNAVWLSDLRSRDLPRPILTERWNVLEATVLPQGDVIASVGTVRQPYLVRVHRDTGAIERLDSIRGSVRYPSVSPDGQRLAFSRSVYGAWHLVVRNLGSGVEQELTHGSYNAISPSWADSRTILYATDSGRGLGLTAIASITLAN